MDDVLGWDEILQLFMNTLPKNLVFVDLETTGGSLRNDRIIEIGIVRVEDGIVVETFSSLINPQKYLPAEIQLLTGITPADLEAAPSFYELKNEIKRLLSDCVFVAHNVRFDYSFLKTAFLQYEMDFSPKQLCTVKLSRKLYPNEKHHNLDALIERFNLKCTDRHRALSDAKAIFQFYEIVQKKFEDNQLQLAFDHVQKRPSIPVNLSKEEIDDLPESPGVYIFYGDNDLPVYVGKSVNIRKRVMQHFSSDHLSSIELKIAQTVKSLKHIKTGGELSALLLESQLVKKLMPLYNRQLRLQRKLTILKLIKDDTAYNKVVVDTFTENTDPDTVLGFFKSKKQAKEYLFNLAEKHNLCEKLLGLENLGKSCFGYRLGKCKGACIKKETHQIYNLRFQIAFAKTKLRLWPFAGPIEIKEEQEVLVVDRWCIVGKKTDEDRESLEPVFDLDTYKILIKFILSPKYAKKIKVVSTIQSNKIQQSFDESTDLGMSF